MKKWRKRKKRKKNFKKNEKTKKNEIVKKKSKNEKMHSERRHHPPLPPRCAMGEPSLLSALARVTVVVKPLSTSLHGQQHCAEVKKQVAEPELNGVEERQTGVSDEEGDRIDGEEELAPPDCENRTQKQTDTEGKRRTWTNSEQLLDAPGCNAIKDDKKAASLFRSLQEYELKNGSEQHRKERKDWIE